MPSPSHQPQPNRAPSGVIYGEHALSDAEMFISPHGVRQLVSMAMDGRVDSAGELLPLEEEFMLLNVPGHMSKPVPSRMRHDLVLPEEPKTEPYGEGDLYVHQNYSISDALYRGFTHEREISLSAKGIERVAYLQARLEQVLDRRPDLKWGLNREQMQNAYHVGEKRKTPPNSDGQLISPVRVYIPGGELGAGIASRMIEEGADFAAVKIWVPQAARGEQNFRQDTPIFTANTAKQLHSVVTALRSVAAQGLLPQYAESPIGIPVEGVPGAFVAQPKDSSFNGEMARFWEVPIRVACNSLPLQAGQVVTPEWLDEAAHRAAIIGQQQAQFAGRNPAHHALIPGQNIGVVLSAIRA